MLSSSAADREGKVVCGHDPVASGRAGSSTLSVSPVSSRILSSGLTWNERKHPFVWVKTAAEVLRPYDRQAISGALHYRPAYASSSWARSNFFIPRKVLVTRAICCSSAR